MSAERSYLQTRKAIMDKIEYEKRFNLWPPEMKNPKMYKSFYWAPDLSFWGFASSKEIGKFRDISNSKEK